MVIVFVVLAILGFLFMITGLVLSRKWFKWIKFNGMYTYRISENQAEKNGTQIKHREFGIQKMKGITGSFSKSYTIPEFYEKLKSRDPNAIRLSLMVFGAMVAVFSLLLAVGTALLEDGNPAGWFFIGAVTLVVLLVTILHFKAVKNSKKPDQHQQHKI